MRCRLNRINGFVAHQIDRDRIAVLVSAEVVQIRLKRKQWPFWHVVGFGNGRPTDDVAGYLDHDVDIAQDRIRAAGTLLNVLASVTDDGNMGASGVLDAL